MRRKSTNFHVPLTFVGGQSLGTERDSSPNIRHGCAVVLNSDYQRRKSKYSAFSSTVKSCDVTRVAPNPIHLLLRRDLSQLVEHIHQSVAIPRSPELCDRIHGHADCEQDKAAADDGRNDPDDIPHSRLQFLLRDVISAFLEAGIIARGMS